MMDLPISDIIRIAQDHGARTVSIFGSHARGTATAESDLDLLIETLPGTSLFDLLRMEIELETLLGIDVEVVTQEGLRPEFKEEVLREARRIAA